MRTSIKLFIIVTVAIVAFYFYSFAPKSLLAELKSDQLIQHTQQLEKIRYSANPSLPAANPPQKMSLHAIDTGSMLSLAGFAYRGGSFTEVMPFVMGAILIKHPKGNLLIDAGFGFNIETHLKTTPMLMQLTAKIEQKEIIPQQLLNAGMSTSDISGVILTHAHWDHVSGLEVLPTLPVWVNKKEMEFITSDDMATKLARDLGLDNYQTYGFADGAYLDFKNSKDWFDDGSVVIVPAPGHSPGSVIIFVQLPNKKQYAFIGDITWSAQGVKLPAEKPVTVSKMVDTNPQKNKNIILYLHQLQKAIPELIIVPAHDAKVWATLPGL